MLNAYPVPRASAPSADSLTLRVLPQHLRDEKTVETEGMKYFNVGWLWDPQRGGHTDGSGASTANGVQDFARLTTGV